MRGPIDYIVVGFEGNKFDGSILDAISNAIDKKIISLVELAFVSRDKDDNIVSFDVSELDDEYFVKFVEKYKPEQKTVDKDDIDEVADLIAPDSTAGLLIIEHLWAKPLKEAIIKANGVLLAEGRIHPEAANTLDVVNI